MIALVRASVLLAALGVFSRWSGRRRWATWIAIGLGLGLWIASAWPRAEIPYDFKRFWLVGRDLNQGVDYYALPADHPRDPILNPPTVLPLFRVLAWMPLPTAAAWWNGLNALAALMLVPVTIGAVRMWAIGAIPPASRSCLNEVGSELDRLGAVVLAVAVAISSATGIGLALGQISLLATFGLVLAVRAAGRGRPGRAGVGLAVATIKAHTLLPFLILFPRRAWLGLAVGSLLLCGGGGPLIDLPRKIGRTLEVIARTHKPGDVNDYMESGPSHASLVGLDHLLCRVGFSRDRRVIGTARLVILAMGGIGLAWLVLGRRVERYVALTLTSLYAGLFLYHRLYDELVLVIPMAIAWERSRSDRADRRAWRVVGVACLLVLFIDAEGLLIVERWAAGAGVAGVLARGFVLPLATWLIVLAVAAVGWAIRADGREPIDASVTRQSARADFRRSATSFHRRFGVTEAQTLDSRLRGNDASRAAPRNVR